MAKPRPPRGWKQGMGYGDDPRLVQPPQEMPTVPGQPQVTQPLPQPQVTPTIQQPGQPTAQAGGFNPDELARVLVERGGYNPTDAANAARGGRATELAREFGVSTGAGMAGITAPTTINLPEMYKSLYESEGISKLEAEYSQKEKEYIEAKAKIEDNPFLSEATMVGRVAKLETLFAERTASLQKDILTKKADVEMQLNLQTQQFNINSQVAQQALSQFNTLLGMGALDDASGADIANITRSTGISSNLIYSAIEASKKKELSVTTYDDGTNEYFVTVDEEGNIVNRQLIGPSGTTGGTVTERYRGEVRQSALVDVQAGITAEAFARKYGGSLEDWELINIYNQSSVYGPMAETPQKFKEWTGGEKAGGLDQEAIDAYASMILAETITISNVPSEYRSEVSKKVSETSQEAEATPGFFQRILETF